MLIKLIYCSNQKPWFYLSILNLALFISCSSNSGSIDNFKQNEQTAFNEGDTKFVPKSWQHMQGRIYRTEAIAEDGKKLWESTTTNNTYSEISETNDEVILEGQSFQVKLTADACYKKMPNEDWTYLYPGGWEFIEDYEAFKNDLMASSSEVPMPPPDEGGSAPINVGNNESNAQSSSSKTNANPNAYQCKSCMFLSMGNDEPLAYENGGCDYLSFGKIEHGSHNWLPVNSNCEVLGDRNTIHYNNSVCGLQCHRCGQKTFILSITPPFGGSCPNSIGNGADAHDWKEF